MSHRKNPIPTPVRAHPVPDRPGRSKPAPPATSYSTPARPARSASLEIWPETGFSRVVSYIWGIKK